MGKVIFEVKMVYTCTEEFYNSPNVQELKNEILNREVQKEFIDKESKNGLISVVGTFTTLSAVNKNIFKPID
jgi:hypothetical protein